MLELFYNFFINISDTGKYKEIEMVMNSPFSTRRETFIMSSLEEKKLCWELLEIKISDISFTKQACRNFFPETCRTKPNKTQKRQSQDSSRMSFVSPEMLSLYSKAYPC